MKEIVAPSIFWILIQAVVGFIVAWLMNWVFARIGKRLVARGKVSAPGKRLEYLRWAITGVAGVATFAAIGLGHSFLTLKPSVEIVSPAPDDGIEIMSPEGGPGYFTVGGNSTRVYPDQKLRLCVLIHSAEPYTAGWWIQYPTVTESDGSWHVQAWVGSTISPPQVDWKVSVMAVAASREVIESYLPDPNKRDSKPPKVVNNPQDLQPRARSHIVHVSIKGIKRSE